MHKTGKLPEILAPAGNRAAFEGAVTAGADAVYLGGQKFGARAYAENFSFEELVRTIEDAHILGKKIHLTANTLLRTKELGETVSFVRALWEHGLDCAIIQDLGLMRRLHEECPGLKLHASTQLSVTLPEGARYLASLGCSRIVPARELSLQEVRTLKEETGLEVETFIHGAMCYSYSGRCLMSSFLGGRSGNRGRCAGTCRLPYRILGEDGRPFGPDAARSEYYPLSMRDLCVLEILPELIDAGIDSFKIEGRMKKPEYAAGTSAIYRKYIDRYAAWDAAGRKTPWKVEKEDLLLLRSLYLRTDLSTGYYRKRNGRELLTIGLPGYTGTDDKLTREIRDRYLRGLPKTEIEGRAYFVPGKPAELCVRLCDNSDNRDNKTEKSRDSGNVKSGAEAAENGCSKDKDEKQTFIKVAGDLVSEPLTRPVTADELRRRLMKTGDSPFAFSSLEVETEGDVFLPVSSVNSLRRKALEELKSQVLAERSPYCPEAAGRSPYCPETAEGCCSFEEETPVIPPHSEERNEGISSISARAEVRKIWALVCSPEQLRAAVREGADCVVIEDTDALKKEIRSLNDRAGSVEVYLAFPYIYRESSRRSLGEAVQFARQNCKGILVRTAEEIQFLKEQGYSGQLIADSSLYAWNAGSMKLLREDCSRVVLPLELAEEDLAELCAGPGEGISVLPVYGRAPLMISAGCVLQTEKVCRKKRGGSTFVQIEDRKKARFPVHCVCEHCSNVIFNSIPTSLHKLAMSGSTPLYKPAASGGSGLKGRNLTAAAAGPDFLLSFTTESGEMTGKCIRWFRSPEGDLPYKDYTGGHLRRGAL